MANSHAKLHTFELEERISKLNPSQEAFVFGSEPLSMIAGGWASGKTTAAMLKALILSAIYPGNQGIIGRYRGTDLEDSTKPVFFDVCPPSWIPKRGGYNKQSNTVTLINGSKIYFRHIHDPNAKGGTKSRRVGANLGWFCIDQAEEVEAEHWNTMMGRLRNRKAGKKFGFGTMNPAGRDWLQKTFFPNHSPLAKGELYRTQKNKSLLGIMVNSEENRVSNGGFVEDDYFDRIIENQPEDWVKRYVYCSFDDFAGRIYKEFNFDSVHVIKPFPIPSHWQLQVNIDVGGDSPWAIVPEYLDDWGNRIVVPGYHGRGVNIRDAAAWIKANLPWDSSRTTYIIDPENKLASIEFAEHHNIFTRPAKKTILPSIQRTAGYFHVQKNQFLPRWYSETQPAEQFNKFKDAGSPRVFVFNTERTFIEQHVAYVWHDKKPNMPADETPMSSSNPRRYDTCDAFRYGSMTRKEASKLPPMTDKYEAMRRVDVASARAADAIDHLFNKGKQAGTLVREATMDETMEYGRAPKGGYEW